jgi:uncharacterized phage protein gp47/JayE
MAFGVTDEGFTLKRLNDILTDIQTDLSSVVDASTGETLTPDLTDENDPLVQMVNSIADQMAECWELAQLCYNQFDPLKATGAGLSGTVQLNGIDRIDGAYSTVALTITGQPLQVIPAGKQVSLNDDSVIFELPEVTLDGSGVGATIGTATELGPFEADAGTVVKILTPVAGWTAVTNPTAATIGSYEETDTALRARQQNSTAYPSQSIIEGIYAGLANIDAVTYARVYQNIELTTDSRGIPAKSVAAVVVGGASADIGDALFKKVPAGVATYGAETETIIDAQGIEYDMAYTIPSDIPVYIATTVQVVNSALWTGDGVARIKAAILEYAAEQYLPGTSVFASELCTPINTVKGIKITSTFVGASSPASADEVLIAWGEIATFDAANISVTVS